MKVFEVFDNHKGHQKGRHDAATHHGYEHYAIGQQDDIVAQREAVAFGHALDAGEHYLVGRLARAELELGGEVAAALLTGAAVGDAMGYAGVAAAGAAGATGLGAPLAFSFLVGAMTARQ
jgi:hypothetical protein